MVNEIVEVEYLFDLSVVSVELDVGQCVVLVNLILLVCMFVLIGFVGVGKMCVLKEVV